MQKNIINQMKKEHPEELSIVNDDYKQNLLVFKELIQSNLFDETNFDLCHQWIQKLNKCKVNETITRNFFLNLLCSQLKTGQISQPFTNLQNLKKPLFKIVMKNKLNDFLSDFDEVPKIGDTEKAKIKYFLSELDEVSNIGDTGNVRNEEAIEKYKNDFEDLLKFVEIEKEKFSFELSKMNEIKLIYENFYEENMLWVLKQIAVEPDFSKIIKSDFLTKMFEKFPNQTVQNELKEIEFEIKNNFENWVAEIIEKEQKISSEIYKNKSDEILEQNIKLFEEKLDENKIEIKKIESLLQNSPSRSSVSIGTQTSKDSYNCGKNINKNLFRKMHFFYENKLNELNKQKILEEKANQITLAAKTGEIYLEIGTKFKNDFEKFATVLKDEIYDVMRPVAQNEHSI